MSVTRSIEGSATEVAIYVRYSIGNSSGPWLAVRKGEVSVIGRVRYRMFHCNLEKRSNSRTRVVSWKPRNLAKNMHVGIF